MEKIVQYPLTVPPLLQYQLVGRVNTGLARVFEQVERPPLTTAQIEATNKLVRNHLRTPRAIDRFLAQLRHHLPLLPYGEIDDGDVVLLTLLRVEYPSIYRELTHWEVELTTGQVDQLRSTASSSPQMARFDANELLQDVPNNARVDALHLLHALFPKLQNPSVRDLAGQRVANGRYFARYFYMGIPDHDVSDFAVRQALSEMRSGSPENLQKLLTDANEDQAYLAMEKAHEHALGDWSPDQLLALTSSLCAILENLPQHPGFLFSARDRAISWIGDILRILPTTTEAAAVQDALRNTEPATRFTIFQQANYGASPDESTHTWTHAVGRELAQEAVSLVLSHLKQRDQAEEWPVGYFINFAIDHGEGPSIKRAIQELVDIGTITVDDVAARAVGTSQLTGSARGSAGIGDVNQDVWDWIAPDVDLSWYQLTRESNVNLADTSWGNRRRFARGRLRPSRNSST